MSTPLALASALGHALSDKRIDILRQIGACGSISQAARAAGVSYKAAWQAVDTLTNLAATPLVAKAVGGAGGGGAHLTAAGRELLAAADAMALARGAVLSRWQGAPHAGPALARLAVRTSMRNQLPCQVQRLEAAGQIVRVHLAFEGDGGAEGLCEGAPPWLASRITRESAELLGLRPGLRVQALCKATAVRVERVGRVRGGERPSPAQGIAPETGVPSVPASCHLQAQAVRVVRGALGDEVSARLVASGLQMVGFAPPESSLRAGSRVALVIDETAVVLALADA